MEEKGLRTYVAWYEDRGTGARFSVLVDAVDKQEALQFLVDDGMHVLRIRRRGLVWARRMLALMLFVGGIGAAAFPFISSSADDVRLLPRSSSTVSSSTSTSTTDPLWKRKSYFEPDLSQPHVRRAPRGNPTLQMQSDLREGKSVSADEKQKTENTSTKDAVDILGVLGPG